MERFILRYIGNGILYFKSLNITFRRGDTFDLVEKTGMSLSRLESHPDLIPYLGNVLEIVEIKREYKEKVVVKEQVKDEQLHEKIDILLGSLSPESLRNLVKDAIKDQSFVKEIDFDKKENISNEEDDVRKQLLKDLVFRNSETSKANLNNFGNTEEKIKTDESDGLEDLIDF